jgi:hypothetical protein
MSIKTIAHTGRFHYRSQEATSKLGVALLALVEAGKLAAEAVTTETVEGKELIKRASVEVPMLIPDVRSFIVDGSLTSDQADYLQALIVRHMEDKQKPEVDACTGKVIDWAEVFSAPFTVKVQAVKVTAEMLKAAKAAMLAVLSGKVDGTAYAKDGGLKATDALFDGRASLAACSKFAPDTLRKIESVLTTGAEVLAEHNMLAEHSAAIDLILTNIGNVLNPKQEAFNPDDI